MKKSGAWLVRYALEQVGVEFTFGIPGVHNTEIYDELNKSESINPVLVTHECAAGFMADAISRTHDSVGALVLVPAAGLTHAASGIGEASLDGIPMLVISGGIHTASGKQYQLHDIDQHALMAPITKATFKPETHADIVPMIFEAYRTATSGEPGPVYIEIPVNLQLFTGEVNSIPKYQPAPDTTQPNIDNIQQAAELLASASKPGIFLGWGAREAREQCIALAEKLNAPVATTLQGLASFPGNHPLHTGMSFGPSAVPAAENAFADCDCLLAIGTRFSEIPTGSYGVSVPDNLIHIDINPAVFNANYPAKIAIEGDAEVVANELLQQLSQVNANLPVAENPAANIAADKAEYRQSWLSHDSKGRVNPARFFQSLRNQLSDNAFVIADDGNHTFLTAELMPIHRPEGFISPTDFNCMGYCVPAVNAVKMANPKQQVVGIVGDGAFLMTAMETVTAATHQLGCVYFVFSDGELSQIAQAQEIPFNRKTCTVLNPIDVKALAQATHCEFLAIDNNDQVDDAITNALKLAADNRPVIVDVAIDYSKSTRFTEGAVKTNFSRFDRGTKMRFVGRAFWRKLSG